MVFLLSLHYLLMLYICKFHDNISKGFTVVLPSFMQISQRVLELLS